MMILSPHQLTQQVEERLSSESNSNAILVECERLLERAYPAEAPRNSNHLVEDLLICSNFPFVLCLPSESLGMTRLAFVSL